MTASSPEPSSSLNCEGGHNSKMGSESEESGDCRVAGENTSHMNINDLPDEMLVKIFSHLSFCELTDVIQKVCRHWRRLSQDFELWVDKEYHIRDLRGANFGNIKGGLTDQEAIQTFRDVPNLHKLYVHRCVTSRIFNALCNRCHKLSELRLCSIQELRYSLLQKLVENCPRISTLRISNKLLKFERFAEEISRLKYLRVLDVDSNFTNTVPMLRPLADGCPMLAEVDFGWSTVDMDDLRYFLKAKRKTLKSIHIKWAMFGRCVVPLLTICADSLERLEIYDLYMVRDEPTEVFTALGSLKNLRELTMPISEHVPPGTAALAFMNGGLPKLRVLDLRAGSGLDNETVIAISRGCPALRELVVAGADQLSDVAFSQVHRLEHLETLDVSCCRGLGGSLILFLTKLPRLHTLIMEELDFPKLLPSLSSIHELSGLRCLTLDCSVVTGVPFEKFPGKLVNLRKLNIRSCRGDPKATDGLSEQMPDLKIYGSIQAEQPDPIPEDDADAAEEENEEDGGHGDADEAQDDRWESEADSEGESDIEDGIWDESIISHLFMENG